MLDKITTTTINVATQMELRDLFAALAMQTLLESHPLYDEVRIAILSYAQSDAMLKARTQNTTQGTPDGLV